VVARQWYDPYGTVRASTGTLPTKRTFTGQLADETGLYFYNARYYAPLIGRFISADSIVPGISNPQAWNRYSYVLNNPIIYTDPSGHCPKPPAELGSVICVAGFIPTPISDVPIFVPAVLGLFGLGSGKFQFVGDNRDFSYDSPKDGSRFWVWINADTGEVIESQFHETCRVGSSKCSGPRPNDCGVFNNCLRTTKNDDGSITLEYGAICDDPASLQAACALQADGTLTFARNSEGSFDVDIDADAFPNLEGYYWSNGKLERTLFRLQNFAADEKQSGIGAPGTALKMGYPRDTQMTLKLKPIRTIRENRR